MWELPNGALAAILWAIQFTLVFKQVIGSSKGHRDDIDFTETPQLYIMIATMMARICLKKSGCNQSHFFPAEALPGQVPDLASGARVGGRGPWSNQPVHFWGTTRSSG